MKQVVQLELTPSSAHATLLAATLEVCNAAANEVSEVAYARRVFRNYGLRTLTYARLRAQGLGAQASDDLDLDGRPRGAGVGRGAPVIRPCRLTNLGRVAGRGRKVSPPVRT